MLNALSLLSRQKAPLLLAVLAFLLGACASITAPMSISEGDLSHYLKKTVRQFDRDQLLKGVPLKFDLEKADIDIGPDDREIVRLNLGGEVALDAVIIDIPATINMTVEALPVFDPKKKAVFIRRLKLVDSDISATFLDKFKLDDATAKIAVRALAKLLDDVPVYRLDESNWAEKLVALSGMTMKVRKGRLVFVKEQ